MMRIKHSIYIILLLCGITFTFAQNYEIEPQDTLMFKPIKVGLSERDTVFIINTCLTDTIIRLGNDTKIIGPDTIYTINYEQNQASPGDTIFISVKFQPDTIGTIHDILQLEIRSIPASFNVTDSIYLQGTGLSPKIETDIKTLNFGPHIINTLTDTTISISNTGNDTLKIDSIKISDATHFSFTPSLILPILSGETKFLQVSFSPKDTGNFQATLSIYNNDPDEHIYLIPLTGEGITEGIIDVHPDTLDFDSVAVNKLMTDSLIINNRGHLPLKIDTVRTGLLLGSEFSLGPYVNIINGMEHTSIPVNFLPSSKGPKVDVLSIYTENDEHKSIVLKGVGIAANIEFEPDNLDFGEVHVNHDSTLSILITNSGDADLVFSDSLSFGVHFNLSKIRDSVIVKQDSTYIEPIIFSPSDSGQYYDELIIKSNDLDKSVIVIPISGTGVIGPKMSPLSEHIDFGTIVIGSDSVYILTVKNEGDQDLNIDTEQTKVLKNIDFKLDGYNPKIRKGQTGFIPIRFVPISTGNKSDTLRIISNDNKQPQVDIYLSGKGIHLFQQVSYEKYALFKESYGIEIELVEDFDIEDVKVEFKLDGSEKWDSTMYVDQISENIWQAWIDSSRIEAKGFKFRINVLINEIVYKSREYVINVKILPGAHRYHFTDNLKDEWIMFSIPFQSEETQIDTILRDLGSEGSTTWKIYRTDSSGISENYYDYDSLKIMGNYGKFETGNAFWLYLKKINLDQISFPELFSIKEDCTFTYILQPGWNQIGSPFNFQISWLDNIRSNFPDQLAIYHYESGVSNKGWNNDLVDDEDFDLSPWDGYAVYNDSTVGSSLIFDIGNQNNVSSTLLRKSSNVTWKLIFSTQSSGAFSKNAIGMSPLSKSNRDNLDYVNPPIIGQEYVTMYFSHPEWREKMINYCTDFRPINDAGDRWDFTIQSSSRTVRFSVSETDQLPPYFKIKIVDSKLGLSYDINNSESIELNEIQMDEINRFVLLVGDEQYIKTEENKIERFLPKNYVLRQNYPNPFNPGTFIYFEIPEAADVNLSIYNILGQKIITLVNDFKMSGSYRIVWDGTDDKGREVASGIYFYKLTSNRFEKTLKMLKIQ